MTETATKTTIPPAPPKKARTGIPKSTGVTLHDAAGDVMRVTAVVKKDGTATTYVIHRVLDDEGKTKSATRGATQFHPNMDAAVSAVEKIKAQLVAAGWQARQTRVGAAKPDAFDLAHLPAPKKTARR